MTQRFLLPLCWLVGLVPLHSTAQSNVQEAVLSVVYDAPPDIFLNLDSLSGNALPDKIQVVTVFVWDDKWFRFGEFEVLVTATGKLQLRLLRLLDPDYADYSTDYGVRQGMIEYLSSIARIQMRWSSAKGGG